MAKNVSSKKTNHANNRPNCLKVTKNPQKVNLQQVKIVDENGKTSVNQVYAGGDAVTGAATVILAMEAGKVAAKGIDEYIKNKDK